MRQSVAVQHKLGPLSTQTSSDLGLRWYIHVSGIDIDVATMAYTIHIIMHIVYRNGIIYIPLIAVQQSSSVLCFSSSPRFKCRCCPSLILALLSLNLLHSNKLYPGCLQNME